MSDGRAFSRARLRSRVVAWLCEERPGRFRRAALAEPFGAAQALPERFAWLEGGAGEGAYVEAAGQDGVEDLEAGCRQQQGRSLREGLTLVGAWQRQEDAGDTVGGEGVDVPGLEALPQ